MSGGDKFGKAPDVTVTTLDQALQNERTSLLKTDVEVIWPPFKYGNGGKLTRT